MLFFNKKEAAVEEIIAGLKKFLRTDRGITYLDVIILNPRLRSQREDEAEKIAEDFKDFLSSSFERVVKNSGERKNDSDLGFFYRWGSAIFVNLSIVCEESLNLLLQKIIEFGGQNKRNLRIADYGVIMEYF